jgi:hypothetical protein
VAVCNVHSRSASPTSQNITMAIAPWGAWLCAALGAGCAGRDGENFAWSATSEDAGKFYVGLVRDVTAPVSAPRPRVSPSRTLRWINLPRTGEKSSLRYALQLMTPAAHARSPRLTLPRFRAHKIHQPRHILACRNSNPSIYYCLAHYKSFSSSSHDLFLFSLYFTLRARMEIE